MRQAARAWEEDYAERCDTGQRPQRASGARTPRLACAGPCVVVVAGPKKGWGRVNAKMKEWCEVKLRATLGREAYDDKDIVGQPLGRVCGAGALPEVRAARGGLWPQVAGVGNARLPCRPLLAWARAHDCRQGLKAELRSTFRVAAEAFGCFAVRSCRDDADSVVRCGPVGPLAPCCCRHGLGTGAAP